MRKNVFVWILFIISALILYLFSNGSVTLALLAALIAALPVSYALLRLTAGQVDLTLKEGGIKDDRRTFVLSFRNKGILPVAAVEADAVCINQRTGETESFTVRRSALSCCDA